MSIWLLIKYSCLNFSSQGSSQSVYPLLYPPHTEVVGGVYWFHSVRPSVCPSVRLSVRPSVPHAVSALYHLQLWMDSFHIRHKWSLPWEGVSRTMTFDLDLYIRSFGLDLENRVRSVASTVLDGFFLYLAQMITIIRRCVAYYVFFRISRFKILANSWNFSALTYKIYNSQWILSIFSTNDHYHERVCCI